MAWNNLMYSGNKPPCKPNCGNRTISCKFDGSCDKYIKWSANKDKIKQARHDQNGEFINYLHDKKGR